MDDTNPTRDDQVEEAAAVSAAATRPATLQEDAGLSIGPAPVPRTAGLRYAKPEKPNVRPLEPPGPPREPPGPRLLAPPVPTVHPGGPDRDPRRGFTILVAIVAGVLGAALTVAGLAAGGVFDRPETIVQEVQAAPVASAAPVQIVVEGDAPTQAAAVALKVVPSIVAIEVGTDNGPAGFAAFASGSGVVLDDSGLIVTNAHVIADADAAQVVLQDGAIYQARIIGRDTLTDLAVLEIEGASLIPIELGTTEGLAIGDVSIAIGNPLGLPGGASVTVGVVSAFDREVQIGGLNDVLFGMLQTDAPITRGSSGGALVDGEGRLIGITTAIGVTDAGAEGIGFAIPVELMTRITDEIIETGAVRHTFLGVSLQDTYEDQGTAQVPSGAAIIDFVDPSGAQDAGLEAGDRAIEINDKPVRTKEDIINELRTFRVGDTVQLVVVRDGATLTFDVVLGERPGN